MELTVHGLVEMDQSLRRSKNGNSYSSGVLIIPVSSQQNLISAYKRS